MQKANTEPGKLNKYKESKAEWAHHKQQFHITIRRLTAIAPVECMRRCVFSLLIAAIQRISARVKGFKMLQRAFVMTYHGVGQHLKDELT